MPVASRSTSISESGVVIVGAGIAGVSAAYHLAVRHDVPDVVLVDPRPPLTLTSDKSTECYRTFWPNRAMVGLMNRSVDLFEEMAEESGNVFGLSKRGYLYVSADQHRMEKLREAARVSSEAGAGPVRVGSYGTAKDGIDILDSADLREHYPFLTEDAVGAVHARRAGWFSAQQLGAWMLDRVREAGGRLIVDEVVAIDSTGDRIRGVSLASAASLQTDTVIDAAGPLAPKVAAMAGVELPVFAEVHLKVGFKDHLGVVPRDAPMIIWNDPQRIAWSDEERQALSEAGRFDLLGDMPVYCHGRPEGGADNPYFLALWEYHDDVREPEWPLPEDPLYPEVVMRGLTTMVPGLAAYHDRLPHSVVDGGYYSKTVENRPLVGPAGPEGFHLIAAMSGFGVMVSAGAADLLAAHVTGGPLPQYSDSFLLSRYEKADYLAEISAVSDSGQL